MKNVNYLMKNPHLYSNSTNIYKKTPISNKNSIFNLSDESNVHQKEAFLD
jgi:hypothetical protein